MNIDYNKLLVTTGNDEDLAKELIGIFLEDYGQTFEWIARAIQKKKAEELHRVAHKLKGSLSSLGAGTTLDLVVAIETMAINEDLSQAETVFEELKTAMSALVTELLNIKGVPTK